MRNLFSSTRHCRGGGEEFRLYCAYMRMFQLQYGNYPHDLGYLPSRHTYLELGLHLTRVYIAGGQSDSAAQEQTAAIGFEHITIC